MPTGLFFHIDCLSHETPAGHPECVDRLNVILSALEADRFSALKRYDAPLAGRDKLELVHTSDYIDHVFDLDPDGGMAMLDPDTHMSPGSLTAALRAVGAACDAVDRVMAGEIENAFCAVRPPGHHAEPDQAMGFCLFNTVAIAALYARKNHFQHRVAIVDFDVHHGNGTQTVATKNKGLFYASSHQSPLYPGTGHVQDNGAGVIVNAPLAAGSGSKAFRHAYEERVFPALREFKPDFLFVSAGFDGHALDPLADLMLTEDDYHWVTRELKEIAREYCHGRLVSCLEGGYNLSVLGESAAAHVAALME
ncbi:histone deacetylase family protein [Emcibacter sp.]|uniref:histone deacetylase family protein n=1 Tax=Emcibacter sp. TaxID=1979954 RepID=UPI002AA77619|nr:histone deacetylase family protein [Emcibacter sp.]